MNPGGGFGFVSTNRDTVIEQKQAAGLKEMYYDIDNARVPPAPARFPSRVSKNPGGRF